MQADGLLKINSLDNHPSVYEYVLESVFGLYLSDPKAFSAQLSATKLEQQAAIFVTGLGLEFKLPNLYSFACQQIDSNKLQSYERFRQCLYGQQTQSKLRALGAVVVIINNRQNVNESTYCFQIISNTTS